MSNQITIIQPTALAIPKPDFDPYVHFFDLAAAEQGVYDHCANKSPATLKAYSRDLPQFIAFLNSPSAFISYAQDQSKENRAALFRAYESALMGLSQIPNKEIIGKYQAALSHLRSSTINRYMAPVRLFCNNLADQPLNFEDIQEARQMFTLIEKQKAIAIAAKTRTLEDDEVNYEAPIMRRDGRRSDRNATWLTLEEVLLLLSNIDKSTVVGKRNYAFMVLGFNTALRLAEMQRLTLDCFKLVDSETYTITVKGKRNNWTPVPCPKHAYDALVAYIDAYNESMKEYVESYNASGDPYEIGEIRHDTMKIKSSDYIWRPFTKSLNPPPNPQEAAAPMDCRSISEIVRKTSRAVGTQIAPHDMRRTAALIALKKGMPLKQIQVMLRHKSVATTERYLGEFRDYAAATLTHYDCVIA